MRKFWCVSFFVSFLLLCIGTSGATPFTGSLWFEGLQPGEPVDDFYSSLGITFSGFTAVAGQYYVCQGTDDTCSASVAYGSVMNVTPGFQSGLSFYFQQGGSGEVFVFDQLNGQGNLLADVALWPATSEWEPFGFSFSGLAKSAVFDGDMQVAVLTMGGEMVLPEPSTLILLLSGVGGLAYFKRYRR